MRRGHFKKYQSVYILTLTAETPFMILGGFLDKHLSLRCMVTLACFNLILGYFVTAFCLNVHFLLVGLTCGIVGGCSIGLTFNCIGLNAAQWFPTHSATASAISTLGIALGPLVFSPIQTFLINPNNLLANLSQHNGAEVYFGQEEVISRVPSSYIIVAIILAIFSICGISMLYDHQKESLLDELSMSETMSEPLMPKEPAEDLPSESSVDTRCDTLIIISSKTFWLLSTWAFFVNQYPLFMMMNFKTYGETFMHDDSALTYIGSTSSISGALGRVFFGFLLDRTSFKFTSFWLALSQVISMLLIGLSLFHQLMFVYAVLVHVAVANLNGAVIVIQNMTWRVFGETNKGLSVGLVNIAYSCSVVTCGIVGAQVIQFWSWAGVFLTFSVSPILAFLTVLFTDTREDIKGPM
ncbi:apicoplast pyruvate carrier 1-like isoform X2 [Apostichopus japonicus]|uniref:apicoplast pyruvate carrier 1-like isoform X2 n=1 Tax=Stichopus japonicus TaxID=307972 RepID=UPI003AB557DC